MGTGSGSGTGCCSSLGCSGSGGFSGSGGGGGGGGSGMMADTFGGSRRTPDMSLAQRHSR
ncbi:hypothetical protein WJ968_14595 [Achromobacter xylosoxidans]